MLKQNFNNIDLVYCFQDKTLEKALGAWAQVQKDAFPHKAELIDTTVAAMYDFMHSAQAVDNGMVVQELLNKELAKVEATPENN